VRLQHCCDYQLSYHLSLLGHIVHDTGSSAVPVFQLAVRSQPSYAQQHQQVSGTEGTTQQLLCTHLTSEYISV
jgi:hypothetical protein